MGAGAAGAPTVLSVRVATDLSGAARGTRRGQRPSVGHGHRARAESVAPRCRIAVAALLILQAPGCDRGQRLDLDGPRLRWDDRPFAVSVTGHVDVFDERGRI